MTPTEELHKAQIMAHPHYHRLLNAYVNCQKIGAPAEAVARLEEALAWAAMGKRCGVSSEDPALDQFMEAYCEMLNNYHQQLLKPLKEATLFLARIEKALTICVSRSASGKPIECEEEIDTNSFIIDPEAEDELLRKYSGCLKQEYLINKRSNGKLPTEATQQLLNWWTKHYKWPYPSESEKVLLGESTGLEQKQINNWFINQRKRHWKPSHTHDIN